MSDLIRYNIKPGEDGYEIAVSLGGEWVHYSDYARLQQERVHDLNQIGGLQQELARIKAENEELHKDYEALADEHTKLIDRYKTLRAASFVTAVPVEQYERVVDAGDSIITITCQHVHPTMANLALRDWNAAKEGKPSE